MACPSDLALERLLLGRADPDAARHAEECPGCSVRLASMRLSGESFRRFVYPTTVERVEAAAERGPRRHFLQALVPASLLAAAAAAVIAIRPPPPGYLGVKGGDGIGLSLFMPGSTGPRILADGAEVSPRTALRLRLRTARTCRLFLVSVDGAGAVSRLDGAGADGLLLSPGQHDLPGGVELDTAAGPERFFAICSPEGAVTAADVERSARTVGAGGAAGVRRAGALGGLPAGASQTTHLLEKRQ